MGDTMDVFEAAREWLRYAYSVQPRYPNEMATTEVEMKKALADAKAVMEFTRPLYSPRET
jgi:hypothetical protein